MAAPRFRPEPLNSPAYPQSLTPAEITALVDGRLITTSSVVGAGDAHLGLTGSSDGSDYTSDLQTLLDRALTAPLVLIWDGSYGTTGLKLHSNTTILATAGAGGIVRDGANAPYFRNANLSSAAVSSSSDHDITIRGGIWNGNAANQDHDVAPTSDAPWGWTPGLCFFAGAQRVKLLGCTIYKPRTFAVWVMNWKHVICDDILINVGVGGGQNYDGLHFNGPGRYLWVRNLDATTFDDTLALNADEPIGSADLPNWSSLYTGGDMTDVLADGIRFNEDCAFGVRLLTGGSRMDRVTIRNMSGTTSRQIIQIDGYSQENSAMNPAGPGNFGSIVIDGMDCDLTAGGYKNCLIYVNSPVENLTLRNIQRNNSSTTYPTVLIGDSNVLVNYSDITNLNIDGLSSYEESAATAAARQVLAYGRVKNLNIRNVTATLNAVGGQGGPVIEIASQVLANIDSININNLSAQGYANVLKIGASARPRGITLSGVTHEYAGGSEMVDNDSAGVARLRLSGNRAGSLYTGTFGEVAGDVTDNISFSDLTTDMSAHWGFNNALTDASGNGRTLTAGGSAALTYPSGLRGQCVYFNQSNNQHAYINPASWMHAGAGGLTVAGFFYPDSTFDVGQQYQFLVAFGSGTAIEYAIVYDTSGRRFLAYASSNGLIGTLVSAEVGGCYPDKWYHVALRWDSANGLGIWVNGAQASTALASLWNANATVLAVGINSTGTQPFKGYATMVTHWQTRQSDANLLLHENFMSGPDPTFA